MMSTPTNPPQPPSPARWSVIVQLTLSALAALLLLGAAVIAVTISTVRFLTQGLTTADITQPFMVAAGLAFGGILVLPSAWYAWKQLTTPGYTPTERPKPRNLGLILTLVVLVILIAVLLLGNWVSQDYHLAWLFLPPLNILAVGLPALWLVYMGTRGLIPGAPRRRWGVFASGLVLGPFLILILELLLLVGMGVLALVWVMLNPSLSSQLNGIALRLQNAAPNTDAMLRILSPFLVNPGILLLLFAFISLLVPIVEETLKPIGVWLLAGQKLTPAQGFGYGVLSGAGFGLFENLGNTSNGASQWAILASTRISTLLLHCFTAGLVGWALVSAWSQRRFLRLGITYAIAILIHGLWNGMAVLGAVSSLEGVSNVSIPTWLGQLSNFSSIGIVTLGTLVLVLFITANAILRRSQDQMPLPTPTDGSNPPTQNRHAISASEGEAHHTNSPAKDDELNSPKTTAKNADLSAHPAPSGENPPENTDTDS